MIVGFLTNKLTVRGTEVAVYDYAHYNETILGNKSFILTRDYETVKHEFDTDPKTYEKFKKRFEVLYYSNNNDIDDIIQKYNITHLYIIKYGSDLGTFTNLCKTIIHCVFLSTNPHGDVYTPVGQTVNDISGSNFEVLPHIVRVDDDDNNLRQDLGIPRDALVFGRYGGKETFDIGFVHETIKKILNVRDDIYFIFMNTFRFYSHPRVIYLDDQSDMTYKRKFINTTDALLHARHRGETFGLTCGEFAVCKKPVITWGGSQEREHLNILGDKAVVYGDEHELYRILNEFSRDKYNVENNGYMKYTPEYVMNIFQRLCLN